MYLLLHFIAKQKVCEPFVQLRLKIRNDSADPSQLESLSFSLTADKFQVLLSGSYIE